MYEEIVWKIKGIYRLFIQLFVLERKQIALMAGQKLPAHISDLPLHDKSLRNEE